MQKAVKFLAACVICIILAAAIALFFQQIKT